MDKTTRIVAQVAVESIVNSGGDGFDEDTMRLVLAHGVEVGVPDLYLNMLADLVHSLNTDAL